MRGVTRGLGEEAGGGQSRVEVARAGCRGVCPPGREEDDRGGVEIGWAVLGQVSGRQVTSFSLSLFYFCFFYLSILFCVVLV